MCYFMKTGIRIPFQVSHVDLSGNMIVMKHMLFFSRSSSVSVMVVYYMTLRVPKYVCPSSLVMLTLSHSASEVCDIARRVAHDI